MAVKNKLALRKRSAFLPGPRRLAKKTLKRMTYICPRLNTLFKAVKPPVGLGSVEGVKALSD